MEINAPESTDYVAFIPTCYLLVRKQVTVLTTRRGLCRTIWSRGGAKPGGRGKAGKSGSMFFTKGSTLTM
jgi:hypothetical protein